MTIDLELPEPDVAVLRVAGECDYGEAPRLAEAIRNAASSVRVVRLDLRNLEFIDSSGLNAMYQAKVALEAASARLVLVGPTPGVLRVLQIARLDNHFDVRDHVEPLEHAAEAAAP
jgi:anti-anti-sigma factor